jgi:hypothetical protein
MGQMTRQEIVREGLLFAGDSKLTVRAEIWLNTWLRSQYAAFTWPFLLKEKSNIPLLSGQASFLLGAGEGGVPEDIRRVIDPIWLYDTARNTRQQIRIQSFVETDTHNELEVNLAAHHRGLPVSARVAASNAKWGQWEIRFDKWADRNYIAMVKFYFLPANIALGSAGDAIRPIYPNDRTLIKVVEMEALRFKRDPEAQTALEIVSSMVVDDRLKFGEVPGQGDYLDLDRSTFK